MTSRSRRTWRRRTARSGAGTRRSRLSRRSRRCARTPSRTLIAAELARKDAFIAAADAAAALASWPRDSQLRYLAGVAHAMQGDRAEARRDLAIAAADPSLAVARAALAALDAGSAVEAQL